MGSDHSDVVNLKAEAHLPAPATPDNRGKGSSGEIGRNTLQDLFPSNTTYCSAFHVTDLGPGEFRFQRIHKRSGDVHFDLEIPNGDVGGMNIGEGKGLSMVIRDVPFFFHVHLLDLFLSACPRCVGSGHAGNRTGDGLRGGCQGREWSSWSSRTQVEGHM